MSENTIHKIGWFASIMAVAMYFSYIDQIRLNLSGQSGSVVLPLITTINCISWTLYGTLKMKRDWPIIIANVPGIVLGIMTAVTAFLGKLQ